MLVPPDEDGKIRWPTNVLRMLLHGKDKPAARIQPFASPVEAHKHMLPGNKPKTKPKD